jgi:iron complex transport system substrate-binding protein
MVRRLGLIIILLLAVLATPALAQPDANLTGACVETFEANVDYFPDQVTFEYASDVEVMYYPHYKIVRLMVDGVQFEYVLLQCGTPTPEMFEGTEIIDYQVIEVPVRSVITLSATFIPALDIIGELDAVVGLDESDYIYNPALRERADAGDLTEVGSMELNVETVLDLDADLVLANPFGLIGSDVYSQIVGGGVPIALNADYLETTPLGRAEWIKLIALFFNREAEANAHFDGVAERYAALTTLAGEAAERPTVLVNGMFDGTWFVAGGQSYIARLIADAGGAYAWADDEAAGGVPLDFESVVERAADANVWLNPNFWFTLADGLAEDERYAEFAAFQNGQVYNNIRRVTPLGGNDYYEGALANPDLLLADLIAIFHPDLLPEHELVYYVQLPAEAG